MNLVYDILLGRAPMPQHRALPKAVMRPQLLLRDPTTFPVLLSGRLRALKSVPLPPVSATPAGGAGLLWCDRAGVWELWSHLQGAQSVI